MNKSVTIPNSKTKRFALYIIMGMLILFSGVLAACDSGTKNLKFETSMQEVTLYLDDEGGREATVSVVASGANESILKDVYIYSDSNSVSVASQQYVGNGRTDFVLTGSSQIDSATVTVMSNRNLKKTKEIKVKVIEPLQSLSAATSVYKNFVIKGSSTALTNSMITFNPKHTFEKELVFTVKDNPAPSQIRIEQNRLVVDKEVASSIKTIEVIASSAHRQVSGVSLEFAILDQFSKDSLEIVAKSSNIDLKEENSVIYLAKNSSGTESGNAQNEIIEIAIESEHLLAVRPVIVDQSGNKTGDKLAQVVKQSFKKETTAQGTKQIFSVEIASGKQAGESFVFFEIEHLEYGYTYSTLNFKTKVFAYDVIKNILINDMIASENEQYQIFSEYSEGFLGHEFVFSALPSTVAAEYKSFYIETGDYRPADLSGSKILIYTRNTTTQQLQLLQLDGNKFSVEDGQAVYVLANKNSLESSASMTVISKFSADFHTGTEEEKKTTLNFNIIRGVASAEVYGFETGQERVITLNSETSDQQKFYFAVKNEDAQLLNHTTFKVEGNFAVVTNSLKKEMFDAPNPNNPFETEGKALWSVTLKSLADNKDTTGRLVVDFGNGRSLSVKVVTKLAFKPEMLTVDSQKSYENSAIGFYKKNYDDLSFTVALKQGTSAKLIHNLDQSTFNSNYTFAEVDEQTELSDLSINLADYTFSSTSSTISESDLNGYNLLSAKSVGRVLVKATYSGKVFGKTGKYQVLKDLENEDIPVKYFLVEVYVPIVNFDAKAGNNLLYSADTVGFYNRGLTQTTITTTLNYGYLTPTYNEINVNVEGLVKDTQIRIERSTVNEHIYTITILSAISDDGSLRDRVAHMEFSINELGQKRTVRIPFVIRNAEKVSGIELENINEEDGIYMHVDKDSIFKVGAKAQNLTAFNSNFVYSFEADAGTQNPNDILEINENTGLITLKGNKSGGTGTIKIIPQDAFVVNALGQRELSSENRVAKVVRIVVADGRTKQTAIRINELSEITEDLTRHYVLTSNIAIGNDWVEKDFSGGLYGRLTPEEDMKQITFNSSSGLFDNLFQTAIIEDLILVGEVTSTGFVANKNDGTIRNVTVDTNSAGGKYSASVVNSSSLEQVGGIVGINTATGIIRNSNFFGKIVAKNAEFAGGIAGENSGLIENSKVEFYTFGDNDFGSITATSGKVGGIVGNLNNGRIVLSYAYSYHNENALFGTDIGAIVGAINGDNAQISKSFARTNAEYFSAAIPPADKSTLSQNITNTYQFYYTNESNNFSEVYRVVGANKVFFKEGIKYYYGSPNFNATYNEYGVTFGSSSPWTFGVGSNNAYPYLKELINEQATLKPNLNLLPNSNLLVNEDGAVFYFYEAVGGIHGLTAQEQAVVKNWNTHSFAGLFGINNANGIKAIVEGSNDAVRVLSNGIELLKPSRKIKLTVFSKYDYTTKKEFDISIIYAAGKLSLTLDNNPILNNSVIGVKGGTVQVVNSNFVSQKVVINRQITFLQDSNLSSSVELINQSYESSIITNPMTNVHVIDTVKFEDLSFVRFSAFAKINNIEDDHYLNTLLKQASLISFSLSTYKGPFEITTDVKEIIKAMPYDKISFNVEVVSDNPDEKIELLIKDQNGSDTFTNRVKYTNMFTHSLSGILSSGDAEELGNGRYKLDYNVSLEIHDDYKNLNFNDILLYVEIKSSDFEGVSAFVEIVMASQEIQYINVFTRELSKYTTEDGFIFKDEISNNIAPGKNALLTLDLFPRLAYFDTIEITSSVVNGQRISFSVLERTQDGKLQRKNQGFRAVTNGISVNKEVLQAGENQEHLSLLYIYATVPSTVVLETTFSIFVRAYGENKELLENSSSEFIIVAKPLIAANISVDGGKSAIVAKGTKSQIRIEMEQDHWLGNQGVLELSAEYENQYGYFEGISISKPIASINEQTGRRVYMAELNVSVLARFVNTKTHSVDVIATVERQVGNLTEAVASSVKIYVVDFLLEESPLQIKTDHIDTNTLETFVGISKALEFEIKTTTWTRPGALMPESNIAIDALEAKVASFKEHNYFYWQDPINPNSKYVINHHEGDTDNIVYKNFLNNLHYVNANGTTTKVLSSSGNLVASDLLSFVFAEGGGISSTAPAGKTLRVEGRRTGRQNLRLMFVVLNPDGTKQQINYNFAINVINYTDEDRPEQIYTAQDFLDIANQEMEQDYILMEDIYLYEYIPFDTSKIRSFDGNNKVISIMSFDLDLEINSSSISLGLFTVVNQITTLKNITVNYYHLNKLLINVAKFSTINVAGFAIENRGIITNSQVLAAKFNPNLPNSPKTNLGIEVVYSSGTSETKISQNISSMIAGFVITNASSGSITNSRVGGTEFVKVDSFYNQANSHPLRVFNISGQGALAGFVYTNNGIVSASFANNINIENQSDVKRETITSGFAGINNGKITLSYSKGAYNVLYPNEIRATGSGISTTGMAAGFIYLNNGNISDSYSNIMIQDKSGNAGRGSAGFVYNNSETGLIEKAYTASYTQERNSSQMNFTGVDESLNILNFGTILNSYYYSSQTALQSSATEIEELYSSGVLKISSFTSLEAFYGFSFATINSNDGVWKITSGKGIDLVSANEIAISHRYVLSDGDDFIFPYTEGYEYGSKANPIVIRNADEFNRVMGAETASTPIQSRFDLSSQKIWGNYRLVANINLSDLGSTKLASTGMSLVNGGVLEGNNLTISNLQMYSSLEYNKKSLGLFATIENGSIVKNLNVNLITIEANNVENVGAITGALIDSKLVNINLKSASSDISAKILGQNIVGGIAGLVSGNSEIVSLTTENISVEVDFFDRNISRQNFVRKTDISEFAHSKLSYAGGIVGILDIFTLDKALQQEFYKQELMSFGKTASLHVKGYSEIKAGTAGGVIGHVGMNTFVRDASYEINAENPSRPQSIVSFKYAAGGVVGELYGSLTQSRIEHEESLQTQIEENTSNYYLTSQTVTRGNMTLFKNQTTTYSPIFVGGLVGKVASGEISNSYSKANVVMETASFVGGAIGAIGDFDYTGSSNLNRVGSVIIEEVYSFGDIKSSSSSNSGAGGFAGFIERLEINTFNLKNIPVQIILNGVNAIVYHSKQISEGMFTNEGGVKTLNNVYDFYAYTYVEGNFVASTDYSRLELNSGEKINEIVMLREFVWGENQAKVLKTYTTQAFSLGRESTKENTYNLKKSTFGLYEPSTGGQIDLEIEGKVTNLNEIGNILSDGRVMDVIFRNNNWDEHKWERKADVLLPKIVFTVTSSIFYIEEPEDFLLMRDHSDKIFIIIGKDSDLDSQGRRLINMRNFKDEDLSDIITNFSGILKGYVKDEEGQTEIKPPLYGFKNLGTSKALIDSSINGALFSDFIIETSGSLSSSDGTILVKSAQGTIFRNILIENSRIGINQTIQSDKTDVGISAGLLVGAASNSVFDIVQVNSTLNRSMIRIDTKNDSYNNSREISAGLIAGSVNSSSKTIFRNVKITSDNSTVDVEIVGSTTVGTGPKTLENRKTVVNMGGIYGYANQNVEILSEDNNHEIIKNISLKFSSGSIGSGGEVISEYYVLNAGAIGGKTDGSVIIKSHVSKAIDARIDAQGIFYDKPKPGQNENDFMVSAAVGGLFGSTSGLDIKMNEALSLNSNVEINLINKIDLSDKSPVMIVGGVVGYASGRVDLHNVNLTNSNNQVFRYKKDEIRDQLNNPTIKVAGKNNNLYVGGLIGRAVSIASVLNSKIPTGVSILIEDTKENDTNSSAVVGGIVGESSFANTGSINSQLILKKSVFNGLIRIHNTKNVTAGGLVGAMDRKNSANVTPNEAEIKDSVFGGQIDIERFAGMNAFAGGVLGKSTHNAIPNDNTTQIEVAGNISYGDINLSDNNIGNDSIVFGGIVGGGSGGLAVIGNTSLTTLFSARSKGDFKAKAIVGDGVYDTGRSSQNFYSSQINLATDNIALATNMLYKDILKNVGTGLFADLHSSLINPNENVYGYKLKPYKITNLTSLNSVVNDNNKNAVYRTYAIFDIKELEFGKNDKPISLLGEDYTQNLALVGDGVKIKANNSQGRVFDIIDNKSFVSGITVHIDTAYYPETYNFEYKEATKNVEYPYDIYGGFAAVNQGVIFGSNVQKHEPKVADGENFYSEIFLSQTTLAGGLVGLNQGFISDSFASVNFVNITDVVTKDKIYSNYSKGEVLKNIIEDKAGDKTYIRPIVSGFVGINEGDISSSYSNGVINAFNSIVFSFGGGNSNYAKYSTEAYSSAAPSIKHSFTMTQSSNAYTSIEVDANQKVTQKLHAFEFGYGADNSNFFDVYATQTSNNQYQRKVTAQMMNIEFTTGNFENVEDKNFGYPSFGKAYNDSNDSFDFMKQTTSIGTTSIGTTKYVPNLGVLQILGRESGESNRTLHLLSDMEITPAMGYVSADSEFKVDEENGNWNPFEISNLTLLGHNHKISGARIYSESHYSLGFFTEMEYSTIDSLVLANGEVVSSNPKNHAVYVGGFVGGTSHGSTIENSTNLGVRIQLEEGVAGGIIGYQIRGDTVLKNNTNTGNVVSEITFGEKKDPISLVGGIAGIKTTTLENNINYGLVLISIKNEQNKNEKVQYINANGIANTGVSDISNTNINKGLAKAYEIGDENIDVSEQFVIQNNQGALPVPTKTTGVTTPKGDGTKEKPYIITSIKEFNYAYDKYTSTGEFNVVFNTDINLAETGWEENLDAWSLFYSGKATEELNIFGNNRTFSYEHELADVSSSFSLFDSIDRDSQITNLNILGSFENAYAGVSLLTKKNEGVIKQTNIYGSILSKPDDAYEKLKDAFLSGFALENKQDGKIQLSNNYSLIQALSGNNAYIKGDLTRAEASNAVNIGGIAGVAKGDIINSINYGALIGGNGGEGFSYNPQTDQATSGKSGDASEEGKNGAAGGHGGSASTIGGVASRVEFESDDKTLITGANHGIIIGGNGGNGGNGQKGGHGGSAIDEYNRFVKALAEAAQGNFIGSLVELFNELFGRKGTGKSGGGGGAGGNGGNSIASGLVGVLKANKENYEYKEGTSKLDNMIIAGSSGEGGLGGEGGAGGGGKLKATWRSFLYIINPVYSYKSTKYVAVGDSGGAGGTGYSGNTAETLQNQFVEGASYYATSAELIKGGEGATGKAEDGIETKDKKISILNFAKEVKRPEGAKPSEEKDNNAGLPIPNRIGFSLNLPELQTDDDGVEYYEINEWIELLMLLNESTKNQEEFEGREYKLMKPFSFGSDPDPTALTLRTLSNYNGTIDGNGHKISVKGRYKEFHLLNNANNKIKNLTLYLELTGFDSSFKGKQQFIASNFDFSKNNVEIKGSVKTDKTIPMLRETRGEVSGLPVNDNDFQFNSKTTELIGTGMASTSAYQISNPAAFEEFIELANIGSKAYYRLTSDIDLTPGEEDMGGNHVIDRFLGKLDGDKKKITLGTSNIDDTNIAFLGLIYELGEEQEEEGIHSAVVKNLTIEGAFITSGVAYENYGTIESVIIGDSYAITSLSSEIAGIAYANYGNLKNVINNTSLTSKVGAAAGIVIENHGSIDGATNNGKITAGKGPVGLIFDNLSEDEQEIYEDLFTDEEEFENFKIELKNGGKGGDAAGIAVTNTGLISSSLNTAAITAGDGGNGVGGGNGGNGGDAAGIAVYNYLDKEADYYVGETLAFGITNVSNSGEIYAGAGGTGATGGNAGNGGNASGIVVYNIFEGMGDEGETVYYKGYILYGDDGVINTGAIVAGTGAVNGTAGQIVVVNDIFGTEGFVMGFPEPEPEPEP